MGDIVPLRKFSQENNQELAVEENNSLVESLFADDAGKTKDEEPLEQDRQEEIKLTELKRKMYLAKERWLSLETVNVDPASETYVQLCKDKEEARQQYRNLYSEYNKDFETDEEIEQELKNIEMATLFLYESSYNDNNENKQGTQIISETSQSDIVASTELQVISQPASNNGNCAQAIPNTPIVINITNGKIEQPIIEVKKPNFIKKLAFDAQSAIGQVVRTIIRVCIKVVLTVYASVLLTLLVNDWFGGILPSNITKHLELIPLYSKIADIVKFIVVHARG